MDWLSMVMGGGVGTALVGGVFTLLQWRLGRKAAREDRVAELGIQEAQELRRLVGVLVEADRTILYDRIKHLGKSYLARGYITVEELEDLNLMHEVYHNKEKLGGNGFLDTLMHTVRELEVRVT